MIDWNAVGSAVAAVVLTGGTLAGGAWAAWQKHQRMQAATRADVAESNAARAVADGEQKVYTLLVARLTALETEMQGVRAELSSERAHNRRLTMRIWELEGLMHQASITIPPFADNDPIKAGGTD